MGWTNLFGRVVVFVGEAIQRADIGEYLQEYASELLDREANEIAFNVIEELFRDRRKITIKKIGGEFEAIFENETFSQFMKNEFNCFDDAICLPIIKIIESTSHLDNYFYALPAFILAEVFATQIKNNLEHANGLDNIYREVFGERLVGEKKKVFINFVSKFGSETAVKRLIEESRPKKTGLIIRRLRLKKLRQQQLEGEIYADHSIFFWGYNKDLKWKENCIKGHFYFDKRNDDPGRSELSGVEELKARIEAHLMGQDIECIAEQLLRGIMGNNINWELREHIRVPRN